MKKIFLCAFALTFSLAALAGDKKAEAQLTQQLFSLFTQRATFPLSHHIHIYNLTKKQALELHANNQKQWKHDATELKAWAAIQPALEKKIETAQDFVNFKEAVIEVAKMHERFADISGTK